MGIYGRWFVATEEDAKKLWSIQRKEALDPFTRTMITADRVVFDDAAIEALPGLYEEFLLAHHVAALFGADERLPSALPLIENMETELVYVPREVLDRFFGSAEADAPYASRWRERLERRRTDDRLRRYDEAAANEELAKELVELGRIALARRATLWGTFH